ncbi:BQ5605_C019g08927 [Microbotryum silenes-dioicae]|uniref:BQ5605_C019g08927 protein n=1 Tax=Microbotryum silenes-dioicae TaxID=796604 RepID=A0A2X0LW19_9BASI|nr:BQ5605_C019g08927 [Microbotryum silenes-dioicae]
MSNPDAGSSPEAKPRFTRTKTGCLTCRRRKKRCPGDYNHEGTCQRCQSNNSVCVPAPPSDGTPIPRRRARVESSATATARNEGEPSSSTPIALSRYEHHSSSSSASPVQSTSSHIYTPPSYGPIPRSLAYAGVPASALPMHILAGSIHAPSSPIAPVHAGSSIHGTNYPVVVTPYHSQSLPPPHATTLPASTEYPPTAYFDSALAPITDLSQMHDIESFFESLNPAIDASNLTADWSIPVGSSMAHSTPSNSTPVTVSAIDPRHGSPSLPPSANTTPSSMPATNMIGSAQVEEEASLAEALTQLESIPIYNALNDAFFSSMPKPVRDILRHRMTDVAFSSSLGKSACLALCLLFRAKTMEDQGSTETRERLIAQSNAYFQQAVEHLQTSRIPLEAQLLAVFDLQMYQLEQWGAAASYAILLLGDYFVSEAMGPKPKIDLHTLSGPSSVLLRSFAYADVLRSVCLRSHPTLFHLVGAPGMPPSEPDSSTSPDPPDPIVTTEALHLLGGLPMGLMLCLGATSNLAYERPSLDPDEYERRAMLIEVAINDWIPLGSMTDDAVRRMDDLTTHEMWRQATIIYFHQTVHRAGPLAVPIRRALQQSLALGSRTVETLATTCRDVPDPHIHHSAVPMGEGRSQEDNQRRMEEDLHFSSVHSHRAAPWFLAATVALTHQERSLCREALKRCRPQKLADENLAAVERIWQLTDERGWPVDWKETLEQQGLFVTFIF